MEIVGSMTCREETRLNGSLRVVLRVTNEASETDRKIHSVFPDLHGLKSNSFKKDTTKS